MPRTNESLLFNDVSEARNYFPHECLDYVIDWDNMLLHSYEDTLNTGHITTNIG